MLSDALHKHLDVMEEVTAELDADIDKIYEAIDKELLLKDPERAMLEVVEAIKELIEEKYIDIAVEKGIDLTELLKKYDKEGKEILIDPSNDPTKNKELFDDKRDGQE